MNLLALEPAFRRHIHLYKRNEDTPSKLAAYLADGVEALGWRWSRTYTVIYTPPETYEVSPDIASIDKRPIILMAAIIYKSGNVNLASFRDQDFSYDPSKGRYNPLQTDIDELASYLPATRLVAATTAPLRGFSSCGNPESYHWLYGFVASL